MRINNIKYKDSSFGKSSGFGYSLSASYLKKNDLKKALGLISLSFPLVYLFLSNHDWDEDKLSDWDEIARYHTNPFSKDTDGDGFTDYEEIYGRIIYIFKNENFSKTSWEPKYSKVNLPNANWRKVEIEFEAISTDDKWDRLYSVFLVDKNGKIELHRGVTPLIKPNEFPNSIKSIEDITPYASLLKGEKEFGTFITAHEGNWDVTVKLRLFPGEENTPDEILPIFYMENLSGESKSKEITFPEFKKALINLHATGHGIEEYAGRDIIIKVDGKEIARTYVGNLYFGSVRGGWNPGQGIIPPIRIDISDKINPGIHEVTIEAPGSKEYWKISLSLLFDK